MPPKSPSPIDEITRELERVNRLQARPDLAKRAYGETELIEAQIRIGDRQNVSPWDLAKMGPPPGVSRVFGWSLAKADRNAGIGRPNGVVPREGALHGGAKPRCGRGAGLR